MGRTRHEHTGSFRGLGWKRFPPHAHTAGPALAEDPGTPQYAQAAPPGPVVTLITGDKVGLSTGDDGVQRAVIQRGEGRDNVTFTQIRNGAGHLSVIPGDARAGLAAGQLDPRLFDVTGLFQAGYDDQPLQ